MSHSDTTIRDPMPRLFYSPEFADLIVRRWNEGLEARARLAGDECPCLVSEPNENDLTADEPDADEPDADEPDADEPDAHELTADEPDAMDFRCWSGKEPDAPAAVVTLRRVPC